MIVQFNVVKQHLYNNFQYQVLLDAALQWCKNTTETLSNCVFKALRVFYVSLLNMPDWKSTSAGW